MQDDSRIVPYGLYDNNRFENSSWLFLASAVIYPRFTWATISGHRRWPQVGILWTKISRYPDIQNPEQNPDLKIRNKNTDCRLQTVECRILRARRNNTQLAQHQHAFFVFGQTVAERTRDAAAPGQPLAQLHDHAPKCRDGDACICSGL